MKKTKRNIAIVCGGDSSEHEVSLRSAQGLYGWFDRNLLYWGSHSMAPDFIIEGKEAEE